MMNVRAANVSTHPFAKCAKGMALGQLRRETFRLSPVSPGWRIECSQLSLKKKSPPQIETALLRGKRFFKKNGDPRRKTFSEYPLCNLLKDLNSQSAIAVDLPKKQFPHGPAHVLFFYHTGIMKSIRSAKLLSHSQSSV